MKFLIVEPSPLLILIALGPKYSPLAAHKSLKYMNNGLAVNGLQWASCCYKSIQCIEWSLEYCSET